jgi:hypothetical protein
LFISSHQDENDDFSRTSARGLGHKKLEHTDHYTELIDLEDDEYNVAHAATLEEENKLIEAGFEYVRYREKYDVLIYRKPK